MYEVGGRTGSRPCMNCEWGAKVRRTIRFSWRSPRNVFDNWGSRTRRLIEKAHQTIRTEFLLKSFLQTTELCKRSCRRSSQQPMHENHLSSQPYASFVTSSSLSSESNKKRAEKFFNRKKLFLFQHLKLFLCYVFLEGTWKMKPRKCGVRREA